MGREIERKFLVDPDYVPGGDGVLYRQGYLSRDPQRVVRVRIAGDKGFITIKGCVVNGSCPEYEYPIPVEEAAEMLESLCDGIEVRKKRFRIPHAGFVWELDIFEGENAGLVLAEVELQSPDDRPELPGWIGKEVTGDRRYYNACLAGCPFVTWEKE